MSPNLNQNYSTTDLLQELNLSLNNAYLYFSKKKKKAFCLDVFCLVLIVLNIMILLLWSLILIYSGLKCSY